MKKKQLNARKEKAKKVKLIRQNPDWKQSDCYNCHTRYTQISQQSVNSFVLTYIQILYRNNCAPFAYLPARQLICDNSDPE